MGLDSLKVRIQTIQTQLDAMRAELRLIDSNPPSEKLLEVIQFAVAREIAHTYLEPRSLKAALEQIDKAEREAMGRVVRNA